MTDPASLTRIAKAVLADMACEKLSGTTLRSMSALEKEPEHVFRLVDLVAKEGKKKRPSDGLISAFAFLIAHGLEVLRYSVDSEDAATIALIARLRQHLIEAGETGRMTPPVLLLVLHQFTAAKLDIGDDLRSLMQVLMTNDSDARAACDRGEAADHFSRMVEQLGGDPFAIYSYLDETIEAMPENGRASLVMATFAEKEPAIREAVVGFLLNETAEVRAKLIELLVLAAPHGLISPTMLRRMIAMRNWIAPVDRCGLDKAIKAARKESIECAPAPRPVVRQVLSSDVDGSGALTLLVIAEEAGKTLVAGLLVKQGFGVRDAWVRRNSSPADLRELLEQVAGAIELSETSLDYARIVCSMALAVNAEVGHPPPFTLVDYAEAIGLAELNPCPMPIANLVADLLSEADATRLSAPAVAQTLRQNEQWLDEYTTLESWFEDNVEKGMGTKRAPHAKQVAFLLAGPLHAHRRRWAELAAWMALSPKHRHQPGDWQGFAILARELLGDRSLDEIGLMKAIAHTTIAVMDMKGLQRTPHAA